MGNQSISDVLKDITSVDIEWKEQEDFDLSIKEQPVTAQLWSGRDKTTGNKIAIIISQASEQKYESPKENA